MKYEINKTRKAVVNILKFFYELSQQNNGKIITMKQKDIALKIGVCRKYVNNIIKFLKNDDYISSEYRHSKPSVIRINFKKVSKFIEELEDVK